MNYLVPYDDSELARIALQEACRIMSPLDHVFVLATVIVPLRAATDVPAGEIWRQTCRAEVHLAHAREHAERVAHFGSGIQCIRVQAPTRIDAIVAGATCYEADTILLAEHTGMRGRLAMLFGPVQRLLREAPCDVRVIYKIASDNDAVRRAHRAATAASPKAPSPSLINVPWSSAQQEPAFPERGGTIPYANE
jgi:nucleotide-binding universal stress UspA family protein